MIYPIFTGPAFPKDASLELNAIRILRRAVAAERATSWQRLAEAKAHLAYVKTKAAVMPGWAEWLISCPLGEASKVFIRHR